MLIILFLAKFIKCNFVYEQIFFLFMPLISFIGIIISTFLMEHMMTFRKMSSLPQNHHLKSTRVIFKFCQKHPTTYPLFCDKFTMARVIFSQKKGYFRNLNIKQAHPPKYDGEVR